MIEKTQLLLNILQKCSKNSLEQEARKAVNNIHKDLEISFCKKQWNNFVSKPLYTTLWTIALLAIIVLIASLFSWKNKYCISLSIDAEEVTKDLEQRISNIITFIGALLTVAVMLINNIKEVVSKKKEYYKIVFEKTQLIMSVIILLVCVVFLLTFSFLKYYLIEKQSILFYTLYGFIYFLIPFAIFLIVRLFLTIKKLFDPSFIGEGLREELKNKTKKRLLEIKIKHKKLELFKENWKKLTKREPDKENSRFYKDIEKYIYENGDICTKSLREIIKKALENNEDIFSTRSYLENTEKDITKKDFDIETALFKIKIDIKNIDKEDTTLEDLLELLGEELDVLIEEGLKKSDKKWNEKAKKSLFETYDVIINLYLKHIKNDNSSEFQQEEYFIIRPIFEQIRNGIIKSKGKSFEITKDLLKFLQKTCLLSLDNVEGKYKAKESTFLYLELDNSKSIPSFQIIKYYLNIYNDLDTEAMKCWADILVNISNRIWGNYHSYDKKIWKEFVEYSYSSWLSFLSKIIEINDFDLFSACYDKFKGLSRRSDICCFYQENDYAIVNGCNETNLPEYLYCKSNFQLFSLICSKYITTNENEESQKKYSEILTKIELRNYARMNRLLILNDLVKQNEKPGAFVGANYMNSDVYCHAYVIDYYRGGYCVLDENFDKIDNIISNDVILKIENAVNYITEYFEKCTEIIKVDKDTFTRTSAAFLETYKKIKVKSE